MYGLETVKAIDASIASAATYTPVVSILGANAVVVRIATCATAHTLEVQVANTTTTSTFLPLVAINGTATWAVALSSTVGGQVVNLGPACGGMKYMRLMANLALVDGQTITVYNVR